MTIGKFNIKEAVSIGESPYLSVPTSVVHCLFAPHGFLNYKFNANKQWKKKEQLHLRW